MKYKNKEIPEGKAAEDLHYSERRAELYGKIAQRGHPDEINRTKQADYYGVNQSTITRDIQAIRDEVVASMGVDAEFIIEEVFKKAIRAAVQENDWDKAVDRAERWGNWLFDRGALSKADPDSASTGSGAGGSKDVDVSAEEAYIRHVEDAFDAGEMGDPADALLSSSEVNPSNIKGGDDESNIADAETAEANAE